MLCIVCLPGTLRSQALWATFFFSGNVFNEYKGDMRSTSNASNGVLLDKSRILFYSKPKFQFFPFLGFRNTFCCNLAL